MAPEIPDLLEYPWWVLVPSIVESLNGLRACKSDSVNDLEEWWEVLDVTGINIGGEETSTSVGSDGGWDLLWLLDSVSSGFSCGASARERAKQPQEHKLVTRTTLEEVSSTNDGDHRLHTAAVLDVSNRSHPIRTNFFDFLYNYINSF